MPENLEQDIKAKPGVPEKRELQGTVAFIPEADKVARLMVSGRDADFYEVQLDEDFRPTFVRVEGKLRSVTSTEMELSVGGKVIGA